jgi:amino acid transporter
MMKAIVIHQFGAPDVMKYEDLPDPQPRHGEIRIAVHAATVNRVLDVAVRRGEQAQRGVELPLIPGVDCAGIIDAIGPGVTKWKVGDRVWSARFGWGEVEDINGGGPLYAIFVKALNGAGVVFFAFIGFDAVSTAAQESKNPKRDMPIGILGSLVVCTLLYILFSHVLTGVANYKDFVVAGKEASVAYAIQHYMPGFDWLAKLITLAILAGFSSVILVMLLGQSRVFYSMSNDGLIPKVFAELHPKFRTPYKSNIILLFFVGIFAAFIPGSVAGDLTSIGTLFAFVLVCVGIWVLRVKNPSLERPFKTPLVPFVPIMGMLVCSAMIISLDTLTQLSALVWMVIGLFVYFFYSRKHSHLRNQ